MTDTTKVENDQQANYPGLTVSRNGDAIVVRIPVRFYRRNGRQMVLTYGRDNGDVQPDLEANGALAKAYRWQEQLESGEYAGLEDLASANGVGRILRLTSLAPDIVEEILNGNEPRGISLAKLRSNLPALWAEQKWACSQPSV